MKSMSRSSTIRGLPIPTAASAAVSLSVLLALISCKVPPMPVVQRTPEQEARDAAFYAHNMRLLEAGNRSHTDAPSDPDETIVDFYIDMLGGCAVRRNGELECWGEGVPRNVPQGKFTQVDGHREHACAIRTDGGIACWTERTGQDGVPLLPPPPAGQFVEVTVGMVASSPGYGRPNHECPYACARREDGSVECWGCSRCGQTEPAPGRYVSIAARSGTICGITTEGAIRCWGQNAGVLLRSEGDFVKLAMVEGLACGIDAEETASCWGATDEGSFPFLWECLNEEDKDAPWKEVRALQRQAADLNTLGERMTLGEAEFERRYPGTSVPYSGLDTEGRTSAAIGGAVASIAGSAMAAFAEVGKHFAAEQAQAVAETRARILEQWSERSTVPPGRFRQVTLSENRSCALSVDGTAVCWPELLWGMPEVSFEMIDLAHSEYFHNFCGVTKDGAMHCSGSVPALGWGHSDSGQKPPTPAGDSPARTETPPPTQE